MKASAGIDRVCVIGAGAIGSLLAGHLSQVCEVWLLTRRPEHAEYLRNEGLTISGKRELIGNVRATSDARDLPPFQLGIFATKATDLADTASRLVGLAPGAMMMTVQNGLGAEEVVARYGDWSLISAVTFMSGRRRSDVHVEYELDTATWLGPWAQTKTSLDAVKAVAELVNSSGLRAEWMADLLPAQWSKLIFNSAVNSTAALTELPHLSLFAGDGEPPALGPVIRALVDEGKAVAAAAGIKLLDDPWDMNVLAVARGNTDDGEYAHFPSMLEDILSHRATEVDFIAGALAREAAARGVAIPVTAAVHRLIKGKEVSWTLNDQRHRAVER